VPGQRLRRSRLVSVTLPVEIRLLSKPGCHLCDDARDVIERVRDALAPDVSTVLHEQNILDDPELARMHSEDIPVVLIEGRRHAIHRVDEPRLTAALIKAAKTRTPPRLTAALRRKKRQ
jgi:hypothetical protein